MFGGVDVVVDGFMSLLLFCSDEVLLLLSDDIVEEGYGASIVIDLFPAL